MRLSDGAVVPGNRHLDAAERERRMRALLRALSPAHRAPDRCSCVAAGVPPVLLSIHSFTDSWKGRAAALARRRAVGQRLRVCRSRLLEALRADAA